MNMKNFKFKMEISYVEIKAGYKIVIDQEFKMHALNRVAYVRQTTNRCKFLSLEISNGQKFDSRTKKQLLRISKR